MSQLPKGTKSAISFLHQVILDGVKAKAAALLPGLAAVPVIGKIYLSLVGVMVEKLILEDLTEEATAIGIAITYVHDRQKFDSAFLRCKMLDKQNPTPEQVMEALNEAKKTMHDFIRRGAIQ